MLISVIRAAMRNEQIMMSLELNACQASWHGFWVGKTFSKTTKSLWKETTLLLCEWSNCHTKGDNSMG